MNVGTFLNWGYWKDLQPPLTPELRGESSAALYRLVGSTLALRPGEVVLEVGCGSGAGAYALQVDFGVVVHGIDIAASQFAPGLGVTLTCAPASAIPYPDARFDALCSVEALQHFPDVPAFVREAARVLRPGGRFCAATFFPSPDASVHSLAELLQSHRTGLDAVTTVEGLSSELVAAGFVDVQSFSIGEHVWQQLDDWIVANGYRHHWGRNFLRAYELGMLDYHVVTART